MVSDVFQHEWVECFFLNPLILSIPVYCFTHSSENAENFPNGPLGLDQRRLSFVFTFSVCLTGRAGSSQSHSGDVKGALPILE